MNEQAPTEFPTADLDRDIESLIDYAASHPHQVDTATLLHSLLTRMENEVADRSDTGKRGRKPFHPARPFYFWCFLHLGLILTEEIRSRDRHLQTLVGEEIPGLGVFNSDLQLRRLLRDGSSYADNLPRWFVLAVDAEVMAKQWNEPSYLKRLRANTRKRARRMIESLKEKTSKN